MLKNVAACMTLVEELRGRGQPMLRQAAALLGDGILLGIPDLGHPRVGFRWIFVHYAGDWRQPGAYAHHDGIWKPVIGGWRRGNGIWSKIYE
jgi:hypothetical protein